MYLIIGKSNHGTEEIDQAETLQEATYLVAEYRIAFGPGWLISAKKVN